MPYSIRVQQKSIKTDIRLGCETCPSRRTLTFPVHAQAILLGIDTSGVASQSYSQLDQLFIDIETGSEIPVYGSTTHIMINSYDDACKQDGKCTNVGRIEKIANDLIYRANNFQTKE